MCPTKSRFPNGVPLTRLFPAVRLVGAIRQAFDLRKLVIAALGLAILQPGWTLLDRLGSAGGRHDARRVRAPFSRRKASLEPDFWSWDTVSRASFPALGASPAAGDSLVRFRRARRRLGADAPGALELDLADHRLGNLWRCDLADRDRASRRDAADRIAWTHSGSRWPMPDPLIVAPLCPLLGVAFLRRYSHATFGLLYRVPAVGPALAGIGLIFRSPRDW